MDIVSGVKICLSDRRGGGGGRQLQSAYAGRWSRVGVLGCGRWLNCNNAITIGKKMEVRCFRRRELPHSFSMRRIRCLARPGGRRASAREAAATRVRGRDLPYTLLTIDRAP